MASTDDIPSSGNSLVGTSRVVKRLPNRASDAEEWADGVIADVLRSGGSTSSGQSTYSPTADQGTSPSMGGKGRSGRVAESCPDGVAELAHRTELEVVAVLL